MWKELVTTMAIACTFNVEKSLLRQWQLLVHVTWKELVTTMAIACTCNVEKSLLRQWQLLVHVMWKELVTTMLIAWSYSFHSYFTYEYRHYNIQINTNIDENLCPDRHY
jgi:magnesium-transporting ATPase (P-type)